MRHTPLGPRKTHTCALRQSGHNSSPASPDIRAQGQLTHAGVTVISVLEKDCLVSQSRHLLPSSRFAEITKRNAQSGWLPIVATKCRRCEARWKHYGGT